jgi:mannan polymerase II complex MNN11 subunit
MLLSISYSKFSPKQSQKSTLNITRWHGTVLGKLALVPQNIMNSYNDKQSSTANKDGVYKEGDFIQNFGDCNQKERNCETEMTPYYSRSLQSLALKQ